MFAITGWRSFPSRALAGGVVAINTWWADMPAERYWVEITDREDLGHDLYAPQVDQSGGETWSYTLVTHVQPGDVVLHYWKQPGQDKAIVGFSRVTGLLEETTIRWQAHGTVGRAAGRPSVRPAWRVALSDYTDLSTPVSLAELREWEPTLRRRAAELAARVDGPLYLPFVFSDKRPLRTAQGYFAKMPAEIVGLIPGLYEALPLSARSASEAPSTASAGGTGYQQDIAVKLAIERHAVDWTLSYFGDRGYLVDDVGSTLSFDVLAVAADHELHIEVKGSSGTSTTVELTEGEVNEATGEADAGHVLVVVDQIAWAKDASGHVETSGGRVRIWDDWVPEEERLVPIRFRYLLPPDGFV